MSDSNQGKWLSPKNGLMLAALLIIGAIVIVALIREKIVDNNNETVSVVGQGKVTYAPDIANVTLGVQVDNVKKADEALNQLNNAINKIIPAVKKLGIAPEDIQTQNYTLFPQYNVIDNVSTVTGYNANQQILVKIRGFKAGSDQVSKVISESSKAGANQIVGVTFDTSQLENLKQEARLKAITDARAKAGNIAQAAGVKLGKVVGWWENLILAPGTGQYTSVDYGKGGMGGGGGASTPSVPSGSQEIIIEINLNYRVK